MQKSYNTDINGSEQSDDYCGTSYAAKLLGLSVGTVQGLVEKSELHGWKTQGGHRRISLHSINDYMLINNIKYSTPELRNKHLRILLVEDDSITREMVRGYCDNSDLPVDCTAMSSGMEALIDISSINPDLLITDLDMPGIDGFELLRTIRQSPQFNQMIILALSALSATDIEKKGGLPEGSIYMAKPLKADWFHGFFTGIIVSKNNN
jgi:excisionase family DNA binding protein